MILHGIIFAIPGFYILEYQLVSLVLQTHFIQGWYKLSIKPEIKISQLIILTLIVCLKMVVRSHMSKESRINAMH